MGRDSSVGIATPYPLDGEGLDFRLGGEIFRTHPSVPGLSPEVERPVRGVEDAPLSAAEVKERVDLYLYSSSGTSWTVLG